MYSSVLASCKFMYESTESKKPVGGREGERERERERAGREVSEVVGGREPA